MRYNTNERLPSSRDITIAPDMYTFTKPDFDIEFILVDVSMPMLGHAR